MSSSCDEQLNKPTEITSAVTASQRNKAALPVLRKPYTSWNEPKGSQDALSMAVTTELGDCRRKGARRERSRSSR